MKHKRNLSQPERPGLTHRLRAWARRHRRIATSHLLRGLCHGAGTTAISLLALWYQNRR